MKVFLDTDIILVLLGKREPYYIHSAKLFTLIDQQKIKAYSSPIAFANLNYLHKKLTLNRESLNNLRKLKLFIKTLSTNEKEIEQDLNSDFNDFEDAIQYFTPVNNGINILITRYTKDFRKEKITILLQKII